MANAIEVADSISNAEEQIERAAKVIGRSRARRDILTAIYYHKKRIKTITEVVERTRIPRMRVLQESRHLFRNGLVRQAKEDGELAYEKIDFIDVHKKRILSLACNPKKLAELPTKRKVKFKLPKRISISTKGVRVNRITIDDVDSFSRVRKMKFTGTLPATLSEDDFKQGIQAILGEPGKFKDWGGEKSDLFSTRVRIEGRRRAAAFGFKGPGLKGKLVPGKMGKNGDQGQRLFQEDADVFFVQHWREIDPSVIDLLRQFAVARAATTGNPVWYGVIDGQDSERLRLAYIKKFKAPKTRR